MYGRKKSQRPIKQLGHEIDSARRWRIRISSEFGRQDPAAAWMIRPYTLLPPDFAFNSPTSIRSLHHEYRLYILYGVSRPTSQLCRGENLDGKLEKMNNLIRVRARALRETNNLWGKAFIRARTRVGRRWVCSPKVNRPKLGPRKNWFRKSGLTEAGIRLD